MSKTPAQLIPFDEFNKGKNRTVFNQPTEVYPDGHVEVAVHQKMYEQIQKDAIATLELELKQNERKARALDWYCTADPEYSISQLSKGKWVCYHYTKEPLESPAFDTALEAIESAYEK